MSLLRFRGFEGWYFNHQKGNDTLAFIPGHAKGYSFIQVITNRCSTQFDVSKLTIKNGMIKAGKCSFSKSGCIIDLPGIQGKIRYKDLTPLGSDIMGPFQYLPMQCRHGVISMHHTLYGSISFDGKIHNFSGGNGYMELDAGTSFPQSYLWVQCNDFDEPCALMVSIAHIPICKASFTGCICALIYHGKEYRFATYHGVRILAYESNHICLLQGKDYLEIDIIPSSNGHPLRSPVNGKMRGTIHESNNAELHVRLWSKGKPIINLRSSHAMYEYVPKSFT